MTMQWKAGRKENGRQAGLGGRRNGMGGARFSRGDDDELEACTVGSRRTYRLECRPGQVRMMLIWGGNAGQLS